MATRDLTDFDDERTERERWFDYALDLTRLHLDERLVRLSDLADDDPRQLSAGVYLHVLDGRLMYVGQSVELARRRETHRESRDWDDEYLLLAPGEFHDAFLARWLNAVEGALIKYLQPPYNFRRWTTGPSGREVRDHVTEFGFRLPNGIAIGKRSIPIVRGPTMKS